MTKRKQHQYKRLPGTARRYKDIATGRVISRREYSKRMRTGKVVITRKVALKVWAYRDYLGSPSVHVHTRHHHSPVYGVNLYFIQKGRWNYFEEVRQLFKEELVRWMGGQEYEESPLSSSRAESKEYKEDDFAFEISDMDRNTFAYTGHWQDGQWKSISIFADFDSETLEEILRSRR